MPGSCCRRCHRRRNRKSRGNTGLSPGGDNGSAQSWNCLLTRLPGRLIIIDNKPTRPVTYDLHQGDPLMQSLCLAESSISKNFHFLTVEYYEEELCSSRPPARRRGHLRCGSAG